MLKDYSFLNVKQVLILMQSYRRRALKHDNHKKSKHLYHFKQYLKKFEKNSHQITKLISYHQLAPFLATPYLYDDDYNHCILVNNFDTTKTSAKKKALAIIKQDKNSSIGVVTNLKLDDEALQKAKQKVFTPSVSHQTVHNSRVQDNQQAKILFKKYYHNDFKKANYGYENIGKAYFSTIGKTNRKLENKVMAYSRDIISFKKIIKSIKQIESINPHVKHNINFNIIDYKPLKLYEACLSHTKRTLAEDKKTLQSNKARKLDDNLLLCNGHVATPRDIEFDVRDCSITTVDYYVKKDLKSVKTAQKE